jgi:DNA polymerase-3 subunit alpha
VEILLHRKGYRCTVRLGDDWRVRMADAMLDQLHGWTSPDGVEITYS